MTSPTEQWRKIESFPNYAISSFGRIMRIARGPYTYIGKILKQELTLAGYNRCRLWNNGKRIAPRVAKLVALTFIGPRPIGKEINHKNRIKTDDRVENLEYITSAENSLRGIDHPAAKLKEKDIHEIRRLIMVGITQQEIAYRFGVHYGTISKIHTGKKWAWLS